MSVVVQYEIDVKDEYPKPSRIMKLCSRERASTSLRRSTEAVIPVGLHPYYSLDRSQSYPHDETRILTGTVYKHFGFGFSLGQFSNILRRDAEHIPCESVSTSIRIVRSQLQCKGCGLFCTDLLAVKRLEHRNHTSVWPRQLDP